MTPGIREIELTAHGLKTTAEIGFPLRMTTERQKQIGEWLSAYHKLLGQAARKELIFYHGTDKAGLQAILSERVLWGKRGTPSRATYLTPDLIVAQAYAKPYLLTVRYTPGARDEKGPLDNYFDESDQCRVYQPIPISDIIRIQGIGVKPDPLLDNWYCGHILRPGQRPLPFEEA